MLYLGSKYQADKLCNTAERLLREAFSSKWLFDQASQFCKSDIQESNRFVTYTDGELPDIANTLRRFEVFDVLPAVLYSLCSLETLLNAKDWQEKVLVSLDPENLRCCMLGSQRLAISACRAVSTLFEKSGCFNNCSKHTCINTKNDLRNEINDLLNERGYVAFQRMTALLVEGSASLCWTCNDEIRARLRASTYAIYDQLDKYFDVVSDISLHRTAASSLIFIPG